MHALLVHFGARVQTHTQKTHMNLTLLFNACRLAQRLSLRGGSQGFDAIILI